jgi:hypothetical protein
MQFQTSSARFETTTSNKTLDYSSCLFFSNRLKSTFYSDSPFCLSCAFVQILIVDKSTMYDNMEPLELQTLKCELELAKIHYKKIEQEIKLNDLQTEKFNRDILSEKARATREARKVVFRDLRKTHAALIASLLEASAKITMLELSEASQTKAFLDSEEAWQRATRCTKRTPRMSILPFPTGPCATNVKNLSKKKAEAWRRTTRSRKRAARMSNLPFPTGPWATNVKI